MGMYNFIAFRNTTFFCVKIESWDFQHLYDLEFRETSQCDWFDRVDCPTVWFNRSGAFCSRYSFFLLLVVLQQKSINFVSRWNCTFRCREWLFEQIDNFRKSNSIAWGQFASSSVRPLRYYTNVVTLFMFQVIFNATKFTIFRLQVFCITAKRIIERRGIQTSSSFVKIWLVSMPEFKANFLLFGIY